MDARPYDDAEAGGPLEIDPELDPHAGTEPVNPSGPKLDDRQRAYIVRCLAEFVPPREIAAGVLQHWGIVISTQAVERYSRSARWSPMLKAWRERWLAQPPPLLYRPVRLMWIQRVLMAAYRDGKTPNLPLMLQAVEQARREAERVESEAGGGKRDPAPTEPANFIDRDILGARTAEEVDAILQARLGDLYRPATIGSEPPT